MHRLIVVGGGAGGIELATRLGDLLGATSTRQRAIVTLVDWNPTHVWKPLLHEVAAGSMDPFTHQLEYAAQGLWHGFQFEQGELKGLDRRARTVTIGQVLDEHGHEILPARELRYDTLVLAIGCTSHFFGVKGAQEHALALDTVAQAERFRRRLVATAMRTQRSDRKDTVGRPCVNIAIVGGGATGVELSAELRNTTHVLAAYGLHKLDPHTEIQITLIESGPRLLPALPERVSAAAEKILGIRSIRVMLNRRVIEVTPTGVHTGSGETIEADLTVWAAGIKAPPILATLDGLTVNAIGQLHVRQTLQTELDDNIFAIGDCAACPLPQNGRTVPPRAQAVHQQAAFLVRSISRRLKGEPLAEFSYRDFGSLVSLGHISAVGNLMGGLVSGSLFIHGFVARVMYQSLYRMHIATLHGWPRMILDTLAHRLRRSTTPRVKLH